MTCIGTPSVHIKNDIIVISPWKGRHILDALGFELLFDFYGRYDTIRISSKIIFKYDDVFGDARMAKLLRISIDIDKPYQEYIIKLKKDKVERRNLLRRSKIIASEGMTIKTEDIKNLACPISKCGRRYEWYGGVKEGYCNHGDTNIIIKKIKGGYLIKKIEYK